MIRLSFYLQKTPIRSEPFDKFFARLPKNFHCGNKFQNRMVDRFKMIASGYVFFVRDGKILLLKRKNTGYMDGMYGVPAGHIEENEPITRGTIRETGEEVGIQLTEENIRLVHVMHRKENDIRMDFFFIADGWKGEPVNIESEKCEEVRWFPIHSLPKNTVGYIRLAIQNWQKKIFYAEVGW